jgi:hypothetical protein
MTQTHKWLNIFILSGEAKLHRGLYEKQYIYWLLASAGISYTKLKTSAERTAILTESEGRIPPD